MATHSKKSTNNITMYYDDACILCSAEARAMQARNPAGIQLMPVDEAIDALNTAGFGRIEALTFLCVQDNQGRWYTHMEAVRMLYKTAGMTWAKWLYLPGIKQVGDWVYPMVARNRYRIPNWLIKRLYGGAVTKVCENGVCRIAPEQR